MPVLRHSINYRNFILTDDAESESIPVKLKGSNQYKYIIWLGFISREEAISRDGVPVKIKVNSYAEDFVSPDWVVLEPDEHIQGCRLDGGVYAIIHNSLPRVV